MDRGRRAAALTAFRAVGATGWGRVDFLMGEDRVPRFLEVNTIPGLTAASICPKSAEAAGMLAGDVILLIDGDSTEGIVQSYPSQDNAQGGYFHVKNNSVCAGSIST
mgnify:CR=1 FL=1